MLDPVSTSLFCSSILYALLRFRDTSYSLLFISLIATIAVGGAITINMPYWPRLFVLLPIIVLLLSGFLEVLWQALEELPWLAIPTTIAGLVLLASIANGNLQWYFAHYVTKSRQSFISAPMDVGNYLRNSDDGSYVYGISAGTFYMDDEVIRFLAPAVKTCTVVNSMDMSQCSQTHARHPIFVVIPGRENDIPLLRRLYPNGRLSILHTYDLGQSIYIYRVNK
jgi:hypothetical protein